MRVLSTIVCGVDRRGRALLQKGENTLEEPLSSTERAFVNAMVVAKVITILPDIPAAPASETKIKVLVKTVDKKSPTSTRVDVAGVTPPRKPMRVRRAATK